MLRSRLTVQVVPLDLLCIVANQNPQVPVEIINDDPARHHVLLAVQVHRAVYLQNAITVHLARAQAVEARRKALALQLTAKSCGPNGAARTRLAKQSKEWHRLASAHWLCLGALKTRSFLPPPARPVAARSSYTASTTCGTMPECSARNLKKPNKVSWASKQARRLPPTFAWD